jgi:hypothetical protein
MKEKNKRRRKPALILAHFCGEAPLQRKFRQREPVLNLALPLQSWLVLLTLKRR